MPMIRLKYVIFAALALQLMAVGSQDVTLTRATMLLTYPLLIIAALVNGRLLGMRLILAGTLFNFIVMAANGGLMPVSAATVASLSSTEAVENLSAGETSTEGKSAVMPEDEIMLGALADRLVIDPPMISPEVVSVGDVLIGTGLTLAIAQVVGQTGGTIFARKQDA